MQLSMPSYIKGLRILLLLSLLVGGIALSAIMVYSVVVVLQSGGTHLPLILVSGTLKLNLDLTAVSLGVYAGYYLLFFSIGLLALFFLFSLYRTLFLVETNAKFVAGLSQSVWNMGWALFLIAYLKQVLWFLAVKQLPAAYAHLVSFSFQLIPEHVIYAVSLMVLSRLFSYAQSLQAENDLTV